MIEKEIEEIEEMKRCLIQIKECKNEMRSLKVDVEAQITRLSAIYDGLVKLLPRDERTSVIIEGSY